MDRNLRAVRIAAIDIGTNTVLLLVADVEEGGAVTPVFEAQETPRLGRSVDASRRIAPAAVDGLVGILRRYAAAARELGAETIAACATSAVRDASNRADLLEAVRRECGLAVEVLDGAAEAEMTFAGAMTGLSPAPRDPAVLDIGGGSTELCYGPPGAVNGGRTLTRVSLEIGSVRLTERHFRGMPPAPGEAAAARTRIVEELAPVVNPGFGGYTLVAVAGTATTLAAIHLGLAGFDRDRIEGCRLRSDEVRTLASQLLTLTPEEIAGLSRATAGREDILAAGALILWTVVEHFGFREVRVSARGLRYGIALREWRRRIGR